MFNLIEVKPEHLAFFKYDSLNRVIKTWTFKPYPQDTIKILHSTRTYLDSVQNLVTFFDENGNETEYALAKYNSKGDVLEIFRSGPSVGLNDYELYSNNYYEYDSLGNITLQKIYNKGKLWRITRNTYEYYP